MTKKTETAVFGQGCFWCSEALYSRLDGVIEAIPGYAGGTTLNPDYESVCTGATGHAEVVRIAYGPDRISYSDLLRIFWTTHDPTTLNRQGHDVGTQYRSIIFTADEAQRKEAEASVRKLEESEALAQPIVTEIKPLEIFYPAEGYHRHYFEKHPESAYCQAVIAPKLKIFFNENPDFALTKAKPESD